MANDKQYIIKNCNKNAILTVIIPIRTSDTYDLVERIKYRSLDESAGDGVSFLVVDYGSKDSDGELIRDVCRNLKFDYVYTRVNDYSFSAGAARNLGAQYARTKYIMHEDVDLFPYKGYYNDLLKEIILQDLDSNWKKFITVPAIYLSEEATESMLVRGVDRSELVHKYLTGHKDIWTVLPASSVILVNRHYYLSIGGYNPAFNGWGLEDLEYAFRLVHAGSEFMPPHDNRFLVEGGYASFSAYRGWRTRFRLHGDLLMRKSIFAVHAYHPRDSVWFNPERHALNKSIYDVSVKRVEEGSYRLTPLRDLNKGSSLIFGRGTFAYNDALLPLWGDLHVKGYQYFTEKSVLEYIRENHIDRVIFTNPYANEERTRTYNAIRSAGVKFYVVERGALPDSMFIDETGFCCESTKYKREHWPELTLERRSRVEAYIAREMSNDIALEKQGDRIGADDLREKLGIPSSKKVLFIPFQSRSDTTVNYFAGSIGSFDNFVDLARDVTRRLSSDWVVIFKNHPLSGVSEDIPGAVNADFAHIKDLINISSYVLLMNSGVGVVSALFGKPVIYTAQAFYADDGLNRHAASSDDVINIINDGFNVVELSRLKFISYLIEDFYSFGKFTTEERNYTDNAKLTITTNIDYYRVNLDGERIMDSVDVDKKHNIKLPIYDIYREWIINNNKNKKNLSTVRISKPNTEHDVISFEKACKLYHSGDYHAALKAFIRISENEGGSVLPLRCAAEAYVKIGQNKMALQLLEKARIFVPDNKNVKRRILELRGKKMFFQPRSSFIVPK